MAHSNTSLNCFANCMKRYELAYILGTKPEKEVSPHLTFGVMAHETLCNAGKLRDDSRDGVVSDDDYYSVIPSEVLFNDLKEEFKIKSWEQYFKPVIKKTAEYEKQMVEETIAEFGPVQIEREVKLSINPDELKNCGYNGITQPVVGIIDLLIYNEKCAVILDYKFSSHNKTQDDFDMNSQLPLYAYLVHYRYGVPLNNIRYGYIDIPKTQSDRPIKLSNGTLSRAKSQNVTQEEYEEAVKELHGDDAYYNCKEGGYYYDCWCNMANNKPAYLSVQYLDMDTYKGILKDLFDAAATIDYFVEHKMKFVKKYDSYSCKGCEYLHTCKPWLTVEGGE